MNCLCSVYNGFLETELKANDKFSSVQFSRSVVYNSLQSHRLQHARLPCPSPRDTWSNRQIWPWSTKGSRAKANRVLPKECTGHRKHPLPTTQEMTLHMDITRRSIPNQTDYIFAVEDGEALYSQQKKKKKKKIPGAESGSADSGNSLLPNSDLN